MLREAINAKSWPIDKSAICADIASRPAVLKVFMKTKDESYFLDEWISHHLAIVGPGNIVVFDNGTTDPGTIDIYRKYADSIHVVCFEGMHNQVHDTILFADFYRAVQQSCKYFTFLDTDERLVRLDEGKWSSDTILDELASSKVAHFPGTWLYNAPGKRHQFVVGKHASTLENGLLWGKPIIGTAAMPSGFINHNVQIRSAFLQSACSPLLFFVLHLAQLSPMQRIKANLNKLVARGAITREDGVPEVMAMDLREASYNVRLYVEEIVRLSSLTEPTGDEPTLQGDVMPQCLGLGSDGSVVFHGERERALLSQFISSEAAALMAFKRAA